MSDGSRAAAGLRERLTSGTEDKLGKALVELIENPLITGTIGRAFDARERAAQAQELALSALNIPTAADIERLTRRLRSVSQRLEGIEDGVHRINRALTDGSVERRLAAMEEQLKTLSAKLAGATPKRGATQSPSKRSAAQSPSKPLAAKPTSKRSAAQLSSKRSTARPTSKRSAAQSPAKLSADASASKPPVRASRVKKNA